MQSKVKYVPKTIINMHFIKSSVENYIVDGKIKLKIVTDWSLVLYG